MFKTITEADAEMRAFREATDPLAAELARSLLDSLMSAGRVFYNFDVQIKLDLPTDVRVKFGIDHKALDTSALISMGSAHGVDVHVKFMFKSRTISPVCDYINGSVLTPLEAARAAIAQGTDRPDLRELTRPA